MGARERARKCLCAGALKVPRASQRASLRNNWCRRQHGMAAQEDLRAAASAVMHRPVRTCVAARFSMTAILLPASTATRSRQRMQIMSYGIRCKPCCAYYAPLQSWWWLAHP